MTSFGAVLDACVLFPERLRDTLLRAAQRGLYRAHWTEEILAELERNLVKSKRARADRARRTLDAMRGAFEDADVRGYEGLIPAMTNHPKDRHVAAAAVACQAKVLVTSNLRDFPQSSLDPYDIDVQSPDEFLTQLLHLDPDLMVDIIEEQAATLRTPPMTVDRICDRLASDAPAFVALVRARRAHRTSTPDNPAL